MISWRRKTAEPDVDESQPTGSGVSWTQGSRLVTGAVTVGLWLLVVCGPVALVWSIVGRPAAVAAAVPQAVIDPKVQVAEQRAEEFAVRVVTVWLSAHRGQEDLVQALLPQSSTSTLPEQGLSVTDPMVASTVAVGDSVWSVTVAAQVSDSRLSARRFFTVPVRVVADSVVAVAMPSERAGSQVVAAPPTLDYSVEVPSGSPLSAVVGDFLNALLAGQGDVERLTAPSSQILAVTPAAFTQVRVSRVEAQAEVPESPAEGVRAEVLVTAVAQVDAPTSGAAKQQVQVQYPLSLNLRAGRWEISAVRDSPLVKVAGAAIPSTKPAPAGSPTPSPSPSGLPTRKK